MFVCSFIIWLVNGSCPPVSPDPLVVDRARQRGLQHTSELSRAAFNLREFMLLALLYFIITPYDFSPPSLLFSCCLLFLFHRVLFKESRVGHDQELIRSSVSHYEVIDLLGRISREESFSL